MRSRNPVRFLKLVVLLWIIAVVPGFSQSPVGAGATPALIQDLIIQGTPSQTVITVSADRLIDYTSYYPNPRLFILDIPEAQSSLPRNFISVKTTLVEFATVSQIGEGQKSLIRIEFNLGQPVQYSLQGEGSKVRLTFSSTVASSETNPAKAPNPDAIVSAERLQPTAIEDVAIQENNDQIEINLLTASKPAFKYFELEKPRRLVIDVENSTFRVLRKSVTVNSDLIQRLRFGAGESSQGKLVRCVFDLSQKAPYEVVGTEAGVLVRFRKSEKPSILTALEGNRQESPKPQERLALPAPIEDLSPSAQLALDTKPLLPPLFLETQALAKPVAPVPPLEVPQLSDPEPLPEIAVSTRQVPAGLTEESLSLAQPSPSNLEVLRYSLPEFNEPPSLPQIAMNPHQPGLNLLENPTSPAQPRLARSALPRVVIPEIREPAPLPQMAMNTHQPRPDLFGSSLSLAKPAPPIGDFVNSRPPQTGIDRLPSQVSPIAMAKLSPPTPVLETRPSAPSLAPRAVPVAPEPKSVSAGPKSVALLTSQAPEQPSEPVKPAPALPAAMTSPPLSGQVISQPTTPVATRYTGELISLELKDADLKDFFRLIGEISGLNIVLDPDVKGSLTIFLNDVPWDQALEVVLKNNSLGKQIEGNVLRIATNATLEAEETQRKRLADARVLAAELQTETRVLSYAKAVDLSAILKKILSARGEIIVDPRTNSMVISDIPSKFPAIDALIKQLDKKIRQVEIEARVIAANRDFLRDVGVQWGAIMGNNASNKISGALPGNPFSRTPPPSVSVPPSSGSGGAANSVPFNVNLPANAATSSLFAAVGFSSNFILDFIITAAERHGNAKLLSKPKIITQDNIEGFVQQGVKIPVQTTINNTVSVQFFDFALKLKVTPQITEEGTIMLNVNIENSTPDFSRQVQGVPTVTTQETRTTILVSNGGTVVVGGVLIDNEQTNMRQVPGFGSLPLVGHLFKQRSITKQTQELVFFLSPRIL